MIRTQITGIGDPFILLHGDTYYMYATSAEDGFKFWTSQDLVEWKEEGYCYRNSPWAENCFWAPEVYERKGKFYLLYTARWSKNHSLRIGIAVADSPCGPFIDLVDGPLFDYGYAVIDATLLLDDDGKEYIYFVRDCSENIIDGVHTSVIYCAEMAEDYRSVKGEVVKISQPDVAWEMERSDTWRWNEGPFVIKHNGKYYLNYSVNCYDTLYYSLGCSEATAPKGPFIKYENNPILQYKENDYSGPGHNCIFTGKDGKLYTAFHVHTYYEKPSGDRRAFIAEVVFDENDRMCIVTE